MHRADEETTLQGRGWQFWIDRGGTFTDIVARNPAGVVQTRKLLSEHPQRYADAAIEGMRDLLEVAPGEPLPTERIESVKMGTTVATNALLERSGEPTLLATTRGFGDVLRIGYQTRPRLFALRIERPAVLYARVVELDERVSARGKVLRPLDAAQARRALQRAYEEDGLRSVAIVLMHGYRYPEHERRVAAIAREVGFVQVSVSSEVSPLMKFIDRGDTTVADAYLSPVLRRYVATLEERLHGLPLMFMQSSGGLADARFFRGRDAILSGPAGGVVGMVQSGRGAGFGKLIGFDMGGTSTDVSHYDGELERTFGTRVAGVRLAVPMMQIHTVAAGGGSVLHFDGARYRVGPDSAGAKPGPACYRAGGPLTVTDCNVMLGKLQPRYFPQVFGPFADQPLDVETVRARFARLAAKIRARTGDRRSPEQVAAGFLAVAVDNMANAIRRISVQRGYDVTEYVLCCFGGAAGQHACLVADRLGMHRVLLHPLAGVLSAYGIGLADRRLMLEQAIEARLVPALVPPLSVALERLASDGQARMTEQGVPTDRMRIARTVHLRYEGADTFHVVPFGSARAMAEAFAASHRRRYGFAAPDKAIVVAAVQLEVIGLSELHGAAPTRPLPVAEGLGEPLERVRTVMGGQTREVAVYERGQLPAGARVDGGALIVETHNTVVVEPGWQARVTSGGDLLLERRRPPPLRAAIGTQVDPVMLEIFNNLFMSVAEQMGSVLQNTAHSVNIKERLDFSCALFDRAGELVANAPHVPVHLGSMSESIKTVIRESAGRICPGDAYMLNAPYNGGTHLPDITVIKPVFASRGAEPLFYVAARGHHADVGGITPGSMPPDSRSVGEEGVLIDNVKVVDGGCFLDRKITSLFSSGSYPARNVAQNLADLQAQLAACEKGAQGLRELIEHFGLEVVHAYMHHVQENAEESVRRVLEVLRDGQFVCPMDDGAEVHVAVRVDHARRCARIDFTGTSRQHEGNYNAPMAVCTAAVLYVFRCLVDADIPLNAGCLKPLEIIVPSDCMLRPRYPAAVAAGNVETSQCIVDALLGALGVLAGSQGTMNNVTFGNESYQYYETLGGGAGAGCDFHGADAVHTHMTNSRLTDAEVLEWRFPVVVERFGIRRGSGGAGRFHGGDGAVRRLRFLEPMTVAILGSRRRVPPHGLDGGGAGACARNWIEHQGGRTTVLGHRGRVQVGRDDVFVIETPGGGGFGSPAWRGASATGPNDPCQQGSAPR